jgi:hypothetical protein
MIMHIPYDIASPETMKLLQACGWQVLPRRQSNGVGRRSIGGRSARKRSAGCGGAQRLSSGVVLTPNPVTATDAIADMEASKARLDF